MNFLIFVFFNRIILDQLLKDNMLDNHLNGAKKSISVCWRMKKMVCYFGWYAQISAFNKICTQSRRAYEFNRYSQLLTIFQQNPINNEKNQIDNRKSSEFFMFLLQNISN